MNAKFYRKVLLSNTSKWLGGYVSFNENLVNQKIQKTRVGFRRYSENVQTKFAWKTFGKILYWDPDWSFSQSQSLGQICSWFLT